MKKHAATLLLTLLLLPTTSFAQNSESATSPVDKTAVIVRLLKEVDAGRAYVAQLEKRESALLDEIAKAERVQATLTDAYKGALLELGSLRATLQHQKNALAEREAQVARITTERDEARKENKSLKRENFLLKAGYVVLTIIRVMK